MIASRYVLGQRVDVLDYSHAVKQIITWARNREHRYVCISNVHMVMEGHDDPRFRDIVNNADLVTADGMPLVWHLRLKGAANATRVRGPNLLPHVLLASANEQVPVAFIGSTPATLEALLDEAKRRFRGVHIAFAESPPFRKLSEEEDSALVERVNNSGAGIVFVGLGCPKQERWMAEHRDRISAVQVGVGAAFDFMAGTKSEAPLWMQRLGLEWLFRFGNEPTRLWRRYLRHNPKFVLLSARELLREKTDRL